MDEKTTHDEDLDESQLPDPLASGEEPNEEAPDYVSAEDEKSEAAPEPDTAAAEALVPEDKEPTTRAVEVAPVKVSRGKKFKHFLLHTKKGKVVLISSIFVLLVAALFTVPTTRYMVAGSVLKKSVSIIVIDSETKKPVSDVSVKLTQYSAKTDSKGKATFSSVPVGPYDLKIEKKYYKSAQQSYTVPILSAPAVPSISLDATGRQVTVVVTNAIGASVVKGATVKLSDTSAVTDDEGEAAIVLPISDKVQKGTVEQAGFNTVELSITVENKADQKVEAKLTPAGTIYYLSKRTGKINVMKSNLDGTNAQVVVEGTGSESDSTTSLLASRDWKYLALLAKRTGDKPKLYLVNTATGQLSTMDEGNADFNLVGWSGSRFIFTVVRHTTNFWDDKGQAIKSYDAVAGKLTTLDETSGSGTSALHFAYETIQTPYILENEVVYSKPWFLGFTVPPPADKKFVIVSVKPDGQNKTIVKEFLAGYGGSIDAKIYKPQEIYFRIADASSDVTFYEYEDKKLVATGDTNDDKFYNGFYPTYLLSPSGDRTMWYESRDGKNVLQVGDKDGLNGKEIASTSDYTPYGWYSDEYVLLSKNGSELYISTRDTVLSATVLPLKVTDYHKPGLTYPGYGYGYGGQ